MTTLEILLLIAGAVILILGYAVPAHAGKDNDNSNALSEEQIRESVNREVESSRGRLEGIVDETVDYAMDKTERSLDKVTNEKMMALSDYSNTILDDINKNHKEVLFMYDMLHDKHENLKSTVSEASQAEKKVKEATREAIEASSEQISDENQDGDDDHSVETLGEYEKEDAGHAGRTGAAQTFVPFVPEHINVGTDDKDDINIADTDKEAVVFKPADETKTRTRKKNTSVPAGVTGSRKTEKTDRADKAEKSMNADRHARSTDESGKEPVLQFAQGMQSRNNNEKILKLHKDGRSNTAIAKELGLGIGEVKLVIDLYENK